MSESFEVKAIHIGLDVSDSELREIMSTMVAKWGFCPLVGKMIDDRCRLVFSDKVESAQCLEGGVNSERNCIIPILSMGFQPDSSLAGQQMEDFRMTIYYWLGNAWMFKKIGKTS